jgi:hypothetical protein
MEQSLAKQDTSIETVRRSEGIDRSPEMAAVASAAGAKALVEARFLVALSRPRDFDRARGRIIAACSRPGFAAKAVYRKPQGKKKNESGMWVDNYIEGLSIRFAEEAIRDYGNIHVSASIIYDDPERSVLRVSATDLECNSTLDDEVVLTKRVERKGDHKTGAAPVGRTVFGERLNSYGDKTYIVEATDDEMGIKLGSAKSKLIRNLGLRLIPGDLLDEARKVCDDTTRREAAQNLPERRQKMALAFSETGVTAKALSEYLGHDCAQSSADEMVELGRVLTDLKEGGKWAEHLAAKRDERAPSAPEAPQVPASEQVVEAKAKPVEVEAKAKPIEVAKGKVGFTDAPTPENPGNEPAVNTADFALWLRARIGEAANVRALNQLAARKAQCPQEDWTAVLDAYTSKKNELMKE